MGRLSSAPARLGHVRQRLARPAKVVDPFYESRAWRDFAHAVKAQRGWRCEGEGCGRDCTGDRRALIADHIVERSDGGADFDPLNVQCLCIGCHNRKTSRARLARPGRWRD